MASSRDTCGNNGYCSGSKPLKLNSECPDVISVWNCSFVDNLTSLPGNFLMMSTKKRPGRTTDPVSVMSTIFSPSTCLGIVISIEISESEPVKITLLSLASILIPVKIGKVVLGEIAFNVSFNCVIK